MKDHGFVVAVATRDGAYLLKQESEDGKWNRDQKFLSGENVNRIVGDGNGRLYAATLSEGVFVSVDGGAAWKPASKGLHVRKVWTVEPDPHHDGVLYAGTQYGHLFRSKDHGSTWEEVVGLHKAPERQNWGIDWGFGTTGLTVHTVKVDPHREGRIFIIASGTGAYRSEDNGETWKLLKKGVNDACPIGAIDTDPSGGERTPAEVLESHLEGVHSCFHKLTLTSRPGTLYLQNHCGVFVSSNSGDLWEDISPDERTRFGFPIDVVENGKTDVFTIPVPFNPYECKEHNVCIRGQLAVYRTGDSGRSWKRLTEGLPNNVHTNVLRDSLTHWPGDSRSIFFGTTTGEVYFSDDLGDTWNKVAEGLGRIQGITALAQ